MTILTTLQNYLWIAALFCIQTDFLTLKFREAKFFVKEFVSMVLKGTGVIHLQNLSSLFWKIDTVLAITNLGFW